MTLKFSPQFEQDIAAAQWPLLSKDISLLHLQYGNPLANEFQYRVSKALRDGAAVIRGRAIFEEILRERGIEEIFTKSEEELVLVD